MNPAQDLNTTTAHPLKPTFIPLTLHNRELLKLLVQECFPLAYTDEFYQKVAVQYKALSAFVTVKEIVVGAIVCRIDMDEATGRPYLHVLIILVLEKYRSLGLAQQMMDFIEGKLKELKKEADFIELHVQKINEKAVGFYTKQRFKVMDEVADYYALEHATALKMRKDLI